jgi:hypothetical protein
MVPTEPNLAISLTNDKTRVHVRIGPKAYSLSLSRAFAFAHELVCRKKYQGAAQICDALVQSKHLGARASIMLAFCKARMKDRMAAGCVVSSLHDGMNLVAKEFVAARCDEQGVLVLSQFTGAARELTDAVAINAGADAEARPRQNDYRLHQWIRGRRRSSLCVL